MNPSLQHPTARGFANFVIEGFNLVLEGRVGRGDVIAKVGSTELIIIY